MNEGKSGAISKFLSKSRTNPEMKFFLGEIGPVIITFPAIASDDDKVYLKDVLEEKWALTIILSASEYIVKEQLKAKFPNEHAFIDTLFVI